MKYYLMKYHPLKKIILGTFTFTSAFLGKIILGSTLTFTTAFLLRYIRWKSYNWKKANMFLISKCTWKINDFIENCFVLCNELCLDECPCHFYGIKEIWLFTQLFYMVILIYLYGMLNISVCYRYRYSCHAT
jgi:hypothetical protein